MGLGGIANPVDRTNYHPSIPLPQAVVDALLQFNGLANRIASREPYDCIREGISLGSDPKAEALRKYAIKWGLLRFIRKARTWARAYGGGAIVLLINDGRESTEPVDETAIRSIIGARVLNRWELFPHSYETDRKSKRCGLPLVYQAQFRGRASALVHHSRVVIMQGIELPEMVMQRQLGWGGSIFDLCWPALLGYQVSMRYLPEMVAKLTQDVYQLAGVEEGIGADLKSTMVDRIEAQHAAKGVLGAVAITENETYTSLSRPVTGIKEILDPLQLDVVANADGVPKVILFSESAGGGIRNGDNPEVIAWYDNCSGRQQEHYTEPTEQILRLHALAQDGPCHGTIPPTMELEWLPLYQSSQVEIDSSEKSRAERRAIDINAAVVSSDEARTDADIKRLYKIEDRTAPAVPGVEPGPDVDDEVAPAANGPAAQDISESALNGAQVGSLLLIIEKMNTGATTYAQAVGALGLAFPAVRGREATILGPPNNNPIATPAGAVPAAGSVPAPGAPLSVPGTDDAEPDASEIPPDVVTTREAAKRFGVKTRTITRLLETSDIRPYRMGANVLVSLSDVARAARAHEITDDDASADGGAYDDPADDDPAA